MAKLQGQQLTKQAKNNQNDYMSETKSFLDNQSQCNYASI